MILDKIVDQKRKEIERLKEEFSLSKAEKKISSLPDPFGFQQHLEQSVRDVSVIAEIKRASPSKGVIREDFNPRFLAEQYEEARVDCISVLTDQPFFQGSLTDLSTVRQSARKTPLLRKDFILDERQVYEARLHGADCILLIAAILEREAMKRLARTAQELGLDVLVEVHDQMECSQVIDLGISTLIGVNNRDLKTFRTSLDTTEQLANMIPSEYTLVSESGIHTPQDIQRVRQAGARAVLVGEHFMRQTDIKEAVESLVGSVLPISANEKREGGRCK